MTTRRTFLKTAASVVLLPTLQWSRLERRRVDLSPFCGDEIDSRGYETRTPFEQRDWTYGTDGKVCVRTIYAEAAPADSMERRAPPVESLNWDHDRLGHWRPLSSATRERVDFSQPCLRCKGSGRNGEAVECQEWGGGSACDVCGGRGEVDYAYRLSGDVYLAPEIVARIATLGPVDYSLATIDRANEVDRLGNQLQPVRFRCGLAEGLVCTLALK